MTVSEIIIAVLLTAVAVSYGWGMRGAVIGGEKGAMLPGALLGLFIAKLSGIPVISDNAVIFSAVGCLAMGYGGFEPYAQTMEMVLLPKSDIFNPKRGYAGLMLKGANWFGICGALLGMSFIAMTGEVYTLPEMILLFALIPFVQAIGIRIFNKPYDKANGIFPKIYFSRHSREEWGGNLLTLTVLLLLTAIKGDFFAFFFGITGIFSGAVGWAISIRLYYITVHPLKNGKYIFGNAQKKGYIDNWKIMEFSLGFIGGGGLAAYFFLRANTVKRIAESINENGLWNPTDGFDSVIAWIALGVALLNMTQYFIKKLEGTRGFELAERAVYFSYILGIIMLGNTELSALVAFLLILWVVTEKTVFDRDDANLSLIMKLGFIAVFVTALICEIFFGISNSMLLTMLMYTFYYIFADVICTVLRDFRGGEKTVSDKFKGCILTYSWFVVLSVVLIAIAVLEF